MDNGALCAMITGTQVHLLLYADNWVWEMLERRIIMVLDHRIIQFIWMM